MTAVPEIEILLATYNGEKYLDEQLASLFGQAWANWRLLVHDDGSTDCTLAIVRHYQQIYPEKIIILNDAGSRLGSCKNFGLLLENSSAPYIMFCDQDDIWLPGKIEMTVKKMAEMTDLYGSDVPMLVYSDMKIVDKHLNVKSRSFWRSQSFNPRTGKKLNRLIVSNVINGSTVMINRKLRDLSLPFPDEALMHDWWVGLVAVALGKTEYIAEPTVLYRQHEENVVGAKWEMSFSYWTEQIRHFNLVKTGHKKFIVKTQQQAGALAARFGSRMLGRDAETATTYAALDSYQYSAKRLLMIKFGFWGSGLIRNAVLFSII